MGSNYRPALSTESFCKVLHIFRSKPGRWAKNMYSSSQHMAIIFILTGNQQNYSLVIYLQVTTVLAHKQLLN